ncbi:LysR family transcriptional regulator [Reyranella sp.]|uniref:LysR family transcriptional regulator n=1 Tax=Reyranella sp. TaxID=1929291 RepID=UPI003784E9FF
MIASVIGDIIAAGDPVSYGRYDFHIGFHMSVDLRHLRHFLVVAEEGHVTRAAERLGMQQPPLSQRIRMIEREVGAQLFRRKPRGVELTEAGRVLRDNAKAMLQHHDRALEATRRAARGEEGILRVGMMPSAPFHPFVPSTIREFQTAFPGISLSLDECLKIEAISRLQDEQMDVAFMRSSFTPPQGLVLYPLLTEPMIAALPANHPLARDHGKPLSLKEAAGETFIAYARQSGPALFEAMLMGCLKAGFTPRIGQEAPRIVSALSLVAAGLGLAIVPQSMRTMALNGVVYRAIKGSVPNAVLTLACRHGDPAAAVRNFVKFVRRSARTPWETD